jgi:hypothetical protein
VRVIKTEEKGSDVNLATYLLADAFRAECQASVVVTNDSDLAEPILLAHSKPAFVKTIRPAALAASQLPDAVRVQNRVLRRPVNW